jgi:UDP-N-acetylmuramoylalanine--D-glutamate ligase
MKVAIIGSGESGVGAALLAHKLGFEPFVSDGGKIADKYKDTLVANEIPFEEGSHNFELLNKVDLVVKSPGVPEKSEVMKMIREKELEVISEIEFASLYYKGTIIAVTGSNGKTTTSGLIYHMLKTAGKDVMLGGNYGDSFAKIIFDHNPEMMVLEVSSFQLDDIAQFKPDIAVLLNITPDHLDRYEYKMENYVDSKFRVNLNQNHLNVFVLNADDEVIQNYTDHHELNGKLIWVSKEDFHDGLKKNDGSTFEFNLKGEHNLFNGKCAIEVCRQLELTEEEIALGLSTFRNLPHRLEHFTTIGGVEYINDSKATNVDSVFYALGAMTKKVVLIMGGVDKGNDYESIMKLVEDKVKALICMGVDNEILLNVFKGKVEVIENTTSMKEAVQKAMEHASNGDVVLLSPACASFDLFTNYIDRGEKFKSEVLSYLQC